jgi:hypothetical protein
MTAPVPKIRKVIAEYSAGGCWLALDMRDGQMSEHPTPEHLVAAVKADDRKHGTGFDVTIVEWRDTPDGFTPPGPA